MLQSQTWTQCSVTQWLPVSLSNTGARNVNFFADRNVFKSMRDIRQILRPFTVYLSSVPTTVIPMIWSQPFYFHNFSPHNLPQVLFLGKRKNVFCTRTLMACAHQILPGGGEVTRNYSYLPWGKNYPTRFHFRLVRSRKLVWVESLFGYFPENCAKFWHAASVGAKQWCGQFVNTWSSSSFQWWWDSVLGSTSLQHLTVPHRKIRKKGHALCWLQLAGPRKSPYLRHWHDSDLVSVGKKAFLSSCSGCCPKPEDMKDDFYICALR